ncbi:hypothetical protein BDB01DRAFT_774698 [Pilobolus umbonatus]|nr:hypothetical protein BDB01DRAFT_774698 [Pilobolus umbonatus]
MMWKSIYSLLFIATGILACEMPCRRGVSKAFGEFYTPVVQATVDNLQTHLVQSITQVTIPAKITNNVESTELLHSVTVAINSSLSDFVSTATSEDRLAQGIYQVIFNEELPYKGDCNHPKRLTRTMPPPGESWTMEECQKMDYRCGNPPSICHFLDDVKRRAIGRIRRQLTEYASFDNGLLVRNLVRKLRKSVHDSLASHGVGRLIEDNVTELYISKIVTSVIKSLDIWVEQDVKQICNTPEQDELCNSWDDEINVEILKYP